MMQCLTLKLLQPLRAVSTTNCSHFQRVNYLSTTIIPRTETAKLNGVVNNNGRKLLIPDCLLADFTRSNTSFFNKLNADQLWKGCTSVSNAGKKRGRGKGSGKKIIKDLNRGQVIGVGKANILWPGLNAPIIQGKEVVQKVQLPPDPEREAKLLKLRDQMGRFRSLRLTPLERGWSGAKMHGRKVGPPDPIGQDTFDGFETIILEMKTVTNMDGNIGRIRRFSCVCFTGNKNGLGGLALAKSPEGRAAIKRSKNRAGQKLLYFQRYKEHTIMHDFFTQFGQTKIFCYKKHEGFGLVCHRIIRAICELIGIKDIYCKIEGPTNAQHIMKGFLLGLLRQKSHHEIAEHKKLILVEQRAENSFLPQVVGIPQTCRSADEITSEETLSFNQVAMDDRLPLRKKKYAPFYTKLPSYQRHLLKTLWRRNHYDLRIHLLATYGGRMPRSHLTEKYPECDNEYFLLLGAKKKAEREAVE